MPLEYATKTLSFYEGWSVYSRALIFDGDDIIETDPYSDKLFKGDFEPMITEAERDGVIEILSRTGNGCHTLQKPSKSFLCAVSLSVECVAAKLRLTKELNIKRTAILMFSATTTAPIGQKI